jgi:hypothetical protein
MFLFCDYETEEIIRKKIELDEKIGEQTGGSGHLSEVSSHLDYVSLKTDESNNIEATYFYTLTVYSEFTMYPSNPPMNCRYRKSLWMNPEKEILQESDKSHYSLDELPAEIAWPMVQDEILQFLEKFLFTIEWEYGDCRAPFRYPPEFAVEKDPKGTPQYVCVVITEDEPVDRMEFRSIAPVELAKLITSEINSRYD